MAMFERDKVSNSNGGTGTVVGANVRLTGILKDTNDIIVHGEVEGEVMSERNITVAETATIKGPMSAENIVIAGSVHGAVTARDKIELLPSGKVFGSMTMKDLTIRSGAVFIGKSTMPDARQNLPKNKPTDDPKILIADQVKKPPAPADRAKVLTYEVED